MQCIGYVFMQSGLKYFRSRFPWEEVWNDYCALKPILQCDI